LAEPKSLKRQPQKKLNVSTRTDRSDLQTLILLLDQDAPGPISGEAEAAIRPAIISPTPGDTGQSNKKLAAGTHERQRTQHTPAQKPGRQAHLTDTGLAGRSSTAPLRPLCVTPSGKSRRRPGRSANAFRKSNPRRQVTPHQKRKSPVTRQPIKKKAGTLPEGGSFRSRVAPVRGDIGGCKGSFFFWGNKKTFVRARPYPCKNLHPRFWRPRA